MLLLRYRVFLLKHMSPKRIAVIGAGISGLTCAYELQKAGCEVKVFEKNDYVAGRMATRKKEGLNFDIGADHLCGLYTELRSYCNEFNIPFDKMDFCVYRILRDGKLHTTDKVVGLLSRLHMIWQFFKTGKGLDFFNLNSAAELDTDNAYDYMKSITNEEIADYIADAFCAAYQFHRATELSKSAVIAMFQTQKHQRDDWYLHRTKGGISALPEALASRLDVQTGVEIGDITGGEISIEGNSYDAAVLATTADIASKIYKNPTPAQKEVLDKTEYACSITLSFKIPRSLLPDISIVWVPYRESQKIASYVNESMKGEGYSSGEESLLSVWLHEPFAKGIIDMTDEEIFEQVKQEFVQVCPWIENTDSIKNFDLHKWSAAMPKFSHRHITRVRDFMKNGQGENNVYLCGDYLNSPWVEGSIRCGQRVAQQIMQA